jgi:hypothetical protein
MLQEVFINDFCLACCVVAVPSSDCRILIFFPFF